MELEKSEILVEKITENLLNAKSSSIVFVFGEKYYGKTKLLEDVTAKAGDKNACITLDVKNDCTMAHAAYAGSIVQICYYCAIVYLLEHSDNKIWHVLSAALKSCSHKNKSEYELHRFIHNFKNQVRHKKYFIEELIDFSDDELRLLLKYLNKNQLKFNFIYNLLDLTRKELDFLCFTDDELITNFLFSLRPSKSLQELLQEFNNKVPSSVFYYFLAPDVYKNNADTDYRSFRTPRIKKLLSSYCKDADVATIDDDEIYTKILQDAYYAQIETPLLSSKEQYLLLSIFMGYGFVHKQLIHELNRTNLGYHITCTTLDSSKCIWNIDGKYRILDGWREYLYLKNHAKEICEETEHFFCSLYYDAYFYSRNYNLTLFCINSDYSFWLNEQFSSYYKNLICNYKKLSSSKHKNGNTITTNDRNGLSNFIVKREFSISEKLIKLSLSLFEETLNFDLLLYILDQIQYSQSIPFDLIEDFLKVSIKSGDKWNDITVVEKVLGVCNDYLMQNLLLSDRIENILGILINISEEYIKQTIKNRGYKIMYDLAKAQSENLKCNVEVFFSYSHKDEALRDELEHHLSILKYKGIIDCWYDRKIVAGEEWNDDILDHLRHAKIILLLVSSDFISSKYIWENEVKIAMERHEKGEAKVIPVILRPVYWKEAPFGKLQALPKDAKPVITWDFRDAAFTNITEGIVQALEHL